MNSVNENYKGIKSILLTLWKNLDDKPVKYRYIKIVSPRRILNKLRSSTVKKAHVKVSYGKHLDNYGKMTEFINEATFTNMKDAGILDPTKVTRTALENAASVAGVMLLTEACIVTINEDKDQSNMGGMGGMM